MKMQLTGSNPAVRHLSVQSFNLSQQVCYAIGVKSQLNIYRSSSHAALLVGHDHHILIYMYWWKIIRRPKRKSCL